MVALWDNSWYTSTWLGYSGALILLFLLAIGVEGLRYLNMALHRKYVVSLAEHKRRTLTQRIGARGIRAVGHMLHVTVAYLVMLVIMSYNVGLFVAILLGFGVGSFVFTDEYYEPRTRDPSVALSKDGVNGDCCAPTVEEEAGLLQDPTVCH